MQHQVTIWQKKYLVVTAQKSKSVWVASGDYEGHSISTQDRSESTALKRWCEAARYKGN